MSEPDAREELGLLVRAFRLHLERQARARVYAVPATPTPVPAGGDEGAELHGNPGDTHASAHEAPPEDHRWEEAPDGPRGDAPGPGEPPPLTGDAPFTEALMEMLGEPMTGRRAAPPPAAPRPAASPAVSGAPAPDHQTPQHRARRMSLEDVRAELGDCQRCKLAGSRTSIVFGVGDPHAALMFVGEAPGFNEDRRGEPFVGKAGQLLDRMIEAMGWTRDTVYIANVLKCRPPNNRDPAPDEVAACQPFLAKQIESVAPRVIVTLGRPASQLLLQSNAPMSALRGRFQTYRGITVMPTFHPAYLLRSPERKRDTWEDLKQVIGELERLGVRPPRPPKT